MLKTLFVWLLLNVLVFTTCIQDKANFVVLHVLLLPCRFSSFLSATFFLYQIATYEVLYIFISIAGLLTNTLRNSGLICRICQFFLCLEAFLCMLTLAVCFSYYYFFHYFSKALFFQLSKPPFNYSNYIHYIFFPKVFAS